jgi:hypothetical protein
MGKLTLDPIRRLLDRMKQENLMRQFGGIQQCPWCKQIAQYGDGWNFKTYDENPMLDVLTCGVCDGTSLWLWGMGMHYQGLLMPPSGLFSSAGRSALEGET